jgi:hypothetical protein
MAGFLSHVGFWSTLDPEPYMASGGVLTEGLWLHFPTTD